MTKQELSAFLKKPIVKDEELISKVIFTLRDLPLKTVLDRINLNLNGEKRAWPEIMVSRLRVNLFGDPICAALARHCLSSTDLQKCPFKELAVYAKERCSSKNTNTEDTDHLLLLLSKLFITYAYDMQDRAKMIYRIQGL